MLNISSNTLNCVLIGVIIAIVVILFYKITQNKNSNLTSTAKQNIKNPDERFEFDGIKNPKAKCDETDTETTNTATDTATETTSASEIKSQYCNLNEMEDMDHRLIRDVIIGKKLQQGDKQHEFERNEIDNYFLQYQNFDDKVNYSSRNRCDVVEQLAQDRTHNTELIDKKGLTIGDIFDGLTRDQVTQMKQCKNPDCIQPSKYDNLTQRQYYVDNEKSNNATFSNYQTKYETDNVNNGGKFYNDIEAHDEMLSTSLMLKK